MTCRGQLDVAGNVGIGTTSPNAKLEIKGDSNDYGGIVLSQNSNWSSRPALWNPGTDTSTHDYEIVGRSAGNASYGFLRLMAGGGNAHNSRIELAAYTGNNNGKNIAFFTNNTQRMILDENGNVGIGTTDPKSVLQVFNDDGLTISGIMQTPTSTTNRPRTAVLRLGSPYSSDVNNIENYCAKITSYNNHAVNYGSDLRFYTHPSGQSFNGSQYASTERMCILSNGYIGIGTTSPKPDFM